MDEPRRAIIYIRVSSKEQLEGHSLDAQREQCLRFVAQRGWTVVEVFEGEGESAKTDKRQGFQKAIAALRAGRGDVLVTHRVDRFARNLRDALAYWHELQALGVGYCSVVEQFDFTTPAGWLMLVMLGALAELFIRNLSAETSKGKRQRALKGLWNGDLAFGYRLAADGRHAEPDPDTAPAVRLAFGEYAKGDRDALAVARALNQAGYRTRGKRGSIPFSKDTVAAMLRNRFYLGRVTYKGAELPGRHEPLISEALWEQCEAARRRRGLAPRSGNRGARCYPLAQLAHCAACRRPLRGQYIHGRRYYRDPDRDYDGRCAAPRYLSADKAEEAAAALLMAIRLPEAGKRRLAARAGQGRDPAAAARTRARAQAKIERANELYLDGLLGRPALDRAVAEARAELDAARPPAPFDAARARQLLDDLPALWEAATPAERKRLLRAMLEKVFFRGPEIVAVQPTADVYPLLRSFWRTRRASSVLQTTAGARIRLVPPATPAARIAAFA